jgi:pilus assembly protein CpaF
VFSIVITEKGGAQRQLDFEGTEIAIGRLEDNDLCLPKNNVSKYHARLVFKDERYVLLDQRSTNGTYVNGRRISAPMVVRRGDKIYIGDFILTLAAPGGPDAIAAKEFHPVSAGTDLRGATLPGRAAPEVGRTLSDRPPVRPNSPAPPPPVAADATRVSSASPPPLPRPAATPRPAAVERNPPPPIAAEPLELMLRVGPPAVDEPASPAAVAAAAGQTSPSVLAPSLRMQTTLVRLMEQLARHMNIADSEERAFPSEQKPVLDRLLDELVVEGAIGPDIDRRFLYEAAVSEATGLGPLDRLLGNQAVREIVVDGPTRVLADLGGGLTPVSSFFSDDGAVHVTARRLMKRARQPFDENQVVHEAQVPLKGGMLVNGQPPRCALQLVLPPLSPRGWLIALRLPPRSKPAPEGQVTEGLLSTEMLDVLRKCVQKRANILVVGPMGVGISTFLAMLTSLGPEHERVVSIEDTPCASLLNPQTLPLSRKALPSASLEELLRRAAQLRYDRLVVDDLRPTEALAALSTAAGASGVILGMHAPTPGVALQLLELMTGAEGSSGRVVKQLLAAAIQLLVHIGPDVNGSRRVLSIAEVRKGLADVPDALFEWDGKAFRVLKKTPSFLAP